MSGSSSRRRGQEGERERNRILITCYMREIFGCQTPKDFLRKQSIVGKSTYYEVVKSLEEEGLIYTAGKKRGGLLKLTPEGIKHVSRVLIGTRTEDLKWDNVHDSMKRYLNVFRMPFTRLSEEERDPLFKLLLLMYPDCGGNNPKEFYENLFNRLAEDLFRDGGEESRKRAFSAVGGLTHWLYQEAEGSDETQLNGKSTSIWDELVKAYHTLKNLQPMIVAYYALGRYKIAKLFLWTVPFLIGRPLRVVVAFYLTLTLIVSAIILSFIVPQMVAIILTDVYTWIGGFLIFVIITSLILAFITNYRLRRLGLGAAHTPCGKRSL